MLHDYKEFDKAISFCSNLPAHGSVEWTDEKGKYVISIENDLLGSCIIGECFEKIFISDYIDTRPYLSKYKFNCASRSDKVLSIGTFKTHNKVKKFCWDNNLDFVTVPIPLSNDFGTNRISRLGFPSTTGKYPIKTVFNIYLINSTPILSNILGFGEFIGLYTSVIDYYSIRSQKIPNNVLKYIVDIVTCFTDIFNYASQKRIHLIIAALLFKVLIMRISPDYQIGCGSDHIFALYFEKRVNMPHGKAVYLGMLISLLLFPEWENFGLNFTNMEKLGIQTGIISKMDIETITAIAVSELLRNASRFRPNRPTNIMPKNFTTQDIKIFQVRVNQYRKLNLWAVLN